MQRIAAQYPRPQRLPERARHHADENRTTRSSFAPLARCGKRVRQSQRCQNPIQGSVGSGLDPAESVIAKIKNNLSICAGLIAAADRDKAPPAPSPSGQTAATNAQSNKTQCPDLTGPGLLLTGQGNLNSAAAGGCQAANALSPTPPPPLTGQPSPAGAPTKPTAQTNQTAEATPSPTPQQPAAPIGEAEFLQSAPTFCGEFRVAGRRGSLSKLWLASRLPGRKMICRF